MKKRVKRQVLVRGNKIFFYGKTAKRIQSAADSTGIPVQEWFNLALRSYIKESLKNG